MANLLYPTARTHFLNGNINMTDGVIRAVLIDTGTYTYDPAHNDYVDLSGIVGAESAAFDGKTTGVVATGVFDANNITFTAVTGATVEALVIFLDTGTAANDLLIAYIDTAASGLPVQPNGGDVTVSWALGGIFSL